MTNIYVGNLSYETSQEDLEAAFNEFGAVERVNIVRDRDTGQHEHRRDRDTRGPAVGVLPAHGQPHPSVAEQPDQAPRRVHDGCADDELLAGACACILHDGCRFLHAHFLVL